ncbi:MAG: hypothetical protein O6829_11855 [Alphaproteobacteria bacterium]|nr:hypothetical protein [Alphaproteobacteria bacterium]
MTKLIDGMTPADAANAEATKRVDDEPLEIACFEDPDPGTAAYAFDLAYAKAIHKIGSLNKLLADYRKDFEASGSTNWGYVGSIGYANEMLDRIVTP